MRATRMFLISAVVATYSHATFAQHGEFALKVQLILDYLGGKPVSAPLFRVRSRSKRVMKIRTSIALTIVTGLPVRNDDSQVIDTCSAKLNATIVSGFQAVKMEVAAEACPEKTRKSGEFSRIFVGAILQLAEWVQKKGKPI